jgi:hypothetical protein
MLLRAIPRPNPTLSGETFVFHIARLDNSRSVQPKQLESQEA